MGTTHAGGARGGVSWCLDGQDPLVFESATFSGNYRLVLIPITLGSAARSLFIGYILRVHPKVPELPLEENTRLVKGDLCLRICMIAFFLEIPRRKKTHKIKMKFSD